MVIITQIMDIPINEKLMAKIRQSIHVKMISNKDYSYRDLTSVFSKMELQVGMRTHSLILASSIMTPIVGIIATPKNRGYMRSIEQEERMVEFNNFSVNSFFNILKATWENREKIRSALMPIITREKDKASRAVDYLDEYMNSSCKH